MTPAYAKLKRELLTRYPLCEICGIRQSVEINHCLYHQHGGIYDSLENCQAVCVECHNPYGHSRANKARHFNKRCAEGYNMFAWNDQVPITRREWWE